MTPLPCLLKILIQIQFWSQTCDELRSTCSVPEATGPRMEERVVLAAPSHPQQVTSARFEVNSETADFKASVFRVFEAPPEKRRFLQFQYEWGSAFCSTALIEPESRAGDLAPLICAWTPDSGVQKRRLGVTVQHRYQCLPDSSSEP